MTNDRPFEPEPLRSGDSTEDYPRGGNLVVAFVPSHIARPARLWTANGDYSTSITELRAWTL
jgi:hypothetical protein